MGSVSHTSDIHVVLSPQMLCHVMTVINSMVQSIGQCVCTLHIFLRYLRLQTKLLFRLKVAFYKSNDLSRLLSWENPFFLPFSFDIPESCLPVPAFFMMLQGERQSGFRVPQGTRRAEGTTSRARHKGQRGCPSSSPQSTSVWALGHANIQPLAWCRSQGFTQHDLFKLERFSGVQ